jgi:hypothetical protein
MEVEHKKEPVTLENIPPSKLLNYVKKDLLKEFFGPQQYAQLEQAVVEETGKPKVTVNDTKRFISTKPYYDLS